MRIFRVFLSQLGQVLLGVSFFVFWCVFPLALRVWLSVPVQFVVFEMTYFLLSGTLSS